MHVQSAERAVAWYEELGFRKESEHRFGPGLPAYVVIARGYVHLHLSEHSGDAQPGTLVYLWVEDVDVISEKTGVPVEQQPWAREVQLTDPDGNRLRIGGIRRGTGEATN